LGATRLGLLGVIPRALFFLCYNMHVKDIETLDVYIGKVAVATLFFYLGGVGGN